MKIFTRKKIFLSLGILFLILLGTEGFLRTYLGFCDTVLMQEDADYEVIAVPNQKHFRFRNHIYYNAFSMRSAEVDTSAFKILGFGDSVLNGGTLTEQDSLATSLLSDSLTNIYAQKVQFLNISSSGWGTKHFYAYLQKNGNFQAKQLFLFLSGEQIYRKMTFTQRVGLNENFPNKQYKIALYELWERYIFSFMKLKINTLIRKSKTEKTHLPIPIQQEWKEGFLSLLAYSQQHNIPITLYFHASKSEVMQGKYAENSQIMLDFFQKQPIRIVKSLENGLEVSDFRDEIHLNESGQRKMARIILQSQTLVKP